MSDVIEEAKAPGVFNLTAFLSGAAYPTLDVKVYTDGKTAVQLIAAKGQRYIADQENSAKRKAPRTVDQRTAAPATAEFDEEIDKLTEQLEKSSLTITLQGMSPAAVDEITTRNMPDRTFNYSGSDEEMNRDLELTAKSIVKIADSEGNLDSNPITVDTVKALRASINGGEYNKIVTGVATVNLNGALFDQATDASFLGGRSNVAR